MAAEPTLSGATDPTTTAAAGLNAKHDDGLARLERAALVITLLALMAPLKVEHGVIGLPLFGVPMAGLFALWALRAVRRGLRPRLEVWHLVLALFAGWMLLGTIIQAPQRLSRLSLFLAALPLAVYARHNYGRLFGPRLILRIAVACIVIQVAVCLAQLLTTSSIGQVQAYFGQRFEPEARLASDDRILRVVGTIGAPNELCAFMAVWLPLIYAAYAHRWRRLALPVAARYALFGLWLISLCVMLLAVSRGTLLAALSTPVVLTFIWWMRRQTRPWLTFSRESLMRWSLACALLCVMLISPWSQARAVDRFAGGAAERMRDTERAVAPRVRLARQALRQTMKEPWLGQGFTRSGMPWAGLHGRREQQTFLRPHNLFLLIMADAGLPALALLGLLIVPPMARYLWRPGGYSELADPLFAALLTYLIAAMFYVVTINHVLWPQFMFMLGLFLATLAMPRDNDVAVVHAPSPPDRDGHAQGGR